MSQDLRIPLDDARQLCNEVIAMLDGTYTRIEYGGSVRRGKALVGDLELIAQVDRDGFDIRIDRRCVEAAQAGLLGKRMNKAGKAQAWGARYKAIAYQGLPLDLWIVRPDRQWGPTAVLRTGPGELNQMLVTQRGYKSQGYLPGLCPRSLVWRDGGLYRLPEAAERPGEYAPLPIRSYRVDAETEEDVFALMGLPCLPPEERKPEAYLKYTDKPAFNPRMEQRPAVEKVIATPQQMRMF
jgi:DNA polymerase/3'-5' exonuclease PolX